MEDDDTCANRMLQTMTADCCQCDQHVSESVTCTKCCMPGCDRQTKHGTLEISCRAHHALVGPNYTFPFRLLALVMCKCGCILLISQPWPANISALYTCCSTGTKPLLIV